MNELLVGVSVVLVVLLTFMQFQSLRAVIVNSDSTQSLLQDGQPRL